MKALRIHGYGSSLEMGEIQPPTAAPGQVVVRNKATSFNPIDPGRASGAMRQIFPLKFPWTPGGDVSGVVESLGEGVSTFKVGDQVFGYSMSGGAYAELVAIDAGALAARPPALTIERAAAVAVVGQAAIQALKLAQVGAGKTLLIHAGSGGVGSLAIQLAHKAGAYVVTTAREKQKDVLRRLGADRVIDYTKERFELALEPLDAVLDLVGGDTLARSYGVVKRGGIIVTANQPPDAQECEKHGIKGSFLQTKVTTDSLNDFASQVTSGKVIPLIDHVETLWKPEGIWAKRSSGTAVGKIVFMLGAP
jgi:NADPH:quinone reductase-like Zn-dependent oxidoreductase